MKVIMKAEELIYEINGVQDIITVLLILINNGYLWIG